MKRGLKVGLTNVSGGQVIVMCSGQSQHEAEGRDLGDSGKNMGEVDTQFLCIAISDQPALELVDAAIAIAFDRKEHVTTHDISLRRKVALAEKFKGTKVKQPAEFLMDGLTPV